MCEAKTAFQVNVKAANKKEAIRKVLNGFYGDEESLREQLRTNLLLDSLPQERNDYLDS